MPLSFLWALVPAMAVQFGGRENWSKPYAKVTVVTRGHVPPELLNMHVEEMKLSVAVMMGHRPKLEESIEEVAVEVKRILSESDEEASISTSVIMAMTAGATTVMY